MGLTPLLGIKKIGMPSGHKEAAHLGAESTTNITDVISMVVHVHLPLYEDSLKPLGLLVQGSYRRSKHGCSGGLGDLSTP